MKIRFLPLLLISPLLVSCRGSVISLKEAKEIVSNLDSIIKNKSYEYKKFTFKYSLINGEESRFVKGTYDKSSQYYTTYIVDHIKNEEGELVYKTKEYWTYVKNNSSNVKKFYDLVRYDGAVNANGEPLVTYIDGDAPKDYKEELWTNKIDGIFLDFHTSYFESTLSTISSLINYKEITEDANVSISSQDGVSLFVEAEVEYAKHLYEIEDGKLKKASIYIDDEHQKTFECNYHQATVTYLNL